MPAATAHEGPLQVHYLIDGPEDAFANLILAHGAGAAMDSDGMNALVRVLATAGFRVARFEFAYMESRRLGARKPPPKAELLRDEYLAAIDAVSLPGPLFIGGKSMGGRVASMIADPLHREGRVAGVLCLGYPFHPPAKPQQLRTTHLEALATPCLICQGTRDAFGTREEVASYRLSRQIELFWLEDGDHDLRPRRKLTGLSHADHLDAMAAKVRDWARRILTESGARR